MKSKYGLQAPVFMQFELRMELSKVEIIGKKKIRFHLKNKKDNLINYFYFFNEISLIH